MKGLRAWLDQRPLAARVVPFVIFLILTSLQGKFGPESHFWFYAGKTVLGAIMLWIVWPVISELRWAFSWEAVVAGIAVFVIWVGIDPYYPKWGKTEITWNPFTQFGEGSPLAWGLIMLRIVGSGLVVPPLEELFYRSAAYRYIVKPDFLNVPLGTFDLRAFLITVAAFGTAHHQWLAAILCAIIYQALIFRKKRLGDAMTAHAITNILLGVWIVWKDDWKFW